MRCSLRIAFVGLLAATVASASSSAGAQRPIPINVESTPPGAQVFVDSTTGAPIGTTPIRNARVPRGNHTLIFRLASHEEARLPINVRRWRETFRMVMTPLGTLVVSAANAAATGASVRIDGQPVGSIPFRDTVQPGRHLVQVGREGHVTFTQWVELIGGQVATLPVTLEREAPETGSLLVAGDISGAPVYLDGDPRGVTPTLIENVPAGQHQLEIRPDGMDVHRQTVRVIAGERLNINPTLRPAPAQVGGLRVMANVPGATISLDGRDLGVAPVSADDITPGQHILEARAEGYRTTQQPVSVESGQQQVVSLQLERDPTSAGGIVVDSNVSGASVSIDGDDRGPVPIVIDTPTPGRHAIIVSAEGYEDFRTTCTTGVGRTCEINARLEPIGTPVLIEANADGATLYIDGDEIGPIPYEGNVPVGEHRLEIRAPGFETHERQINLQPSSTVRTMNVALSREGDMSEEERAEAAAERTRLETGATSFAAAALPTDFALMDFSIGWPHVAEIRLGVGMTDFLEGGFALRTFGRLTEFEARAQLSARPLNQLSVGAQVRLGGGLGPGRDMIQAEEDEAMAADQEITGHDVNSFFINFEAMGTLHFSDNAAFDLWMGVDIASDQYDWSGEESDILVATDVESFDVTGQPGFDDVNAAVREGRQNTVRLRLGGALEIVVDRSWNAWLLVEGILAGPSRDVYGDIFGFGIEDTELYLRLGITHKF